MSYLRSGHLGANPRLYRTCDLYILPWDVLSNSLVHVFLCDIGFGRTCGAELAVTPTLYRTCDICILPFDVLSSSLVRMCLCDICCGSGLKSCLSESFVVVPARRCGDAILVRSWRVRARWQTWRWRAIGKGATRRSTGFGPRVGVTMAGVVPPIMQET